MANQITKIKNFSQTTSDIYFFDNNIWMFILCPIGNYQKDRRQRVYSNFLSNCISLKIPIFTNSLVLSEFSNRYLRLEFEMSKQNDSTLKDFKRDFLDTAIYKKTVQEVKTHINNILAISERCSDEFNSIDMTAVLNDFVSIGFNDSYYMSLAAKKNWIIVSDDSDFANDKVPDKNLKILTA